MMPKCIVFFVLALSLTTAAAADFQRTYDDAANRRIAVFTVHGDIKLSSYDGKDIDISAVIKGPDRDMVEIEDAGFGNQIYIFSKYSDPGRSNAAVDFEIRVPKEIFYDALPVVKNQVIRVSKPPFRQFPGPGKPPVHPAPGTLPHPIESRPPYAVYLRSNSGQVTVSDFAGSIHVETGGQDIEVRNVEGRLYAFSTSGNIRGLLSRTSRDSVLRFSSINGDILMQAPDNISARVYIQSATGPVKTDFPLETKDMRYGPGKFTQGKLGGGNHEIDIRSLSGTISFLKELSEK